MLLAVIRNILEIEFSEGFHYEIGTLVGKVALLDFVENADTRR